MPMQTLDIAATLTKAEVIAKDIRLMRFDVPAGALNLDAGAHVTFRVPKGDRLLERSYSVVNDGDTSARLTIAVKREPNSKGGSKHMWSLELGDRIDIIGNANALPAAFGASNFIVVAGGIGITPMTGMVRALMQTGRPLQMHYCARSPEDAAFSAMFKDLLGANLSMHFDSENDFLDVAKLLDTVGPETILFMCGPAGLMNAIKAGWAERGLPIQNLRYETFANSGNLPTTAFEVTVAETGQTLTVAEDETLLDALIAGGNQVLSDCKRGECGLCKLHVTKADGKIDHRDVFLSDGERAANDSLCACVSRLSGGKITVQIDGITHGRPLEALD